MAILPKAKYRFNAIPIKITVTFFKETEKKIPKIYMKVQKTLNIQSNPVGGKKEVSQYLTLNYTIELLTKTAWYWHKTDM
jgi:hypothetical protein